MTLRLKIVVSDDNVRRVSLTDPVRIEDLIAAVRALVGPNEQRKIVLQYLDEENELIRIAAQEDLEEAMLIMEEQAWKSLRIVLKYVGEQEPPSQVKVECVGILDAEEKEDVVEIVEDIVEEPVEEVSAAPKIQLMPFNLALQYLLDLYHDLQGEEFDAVLRLIVETMKNGLSYEDIVGIVSMTHNEFISGIDFETAKLAAISLASMVHLIEDGDLHNVGVLVPHLVKYGFPVDTPFRFEDFKVNLAGLLDVEGLPEELALVRNALLVFVNKINVPEDADDHVDQVVHENYRCDGCGVKPIVGNRYHCHQCEDYDLCENCEQSDVHDPSHDMIKIRRAVIEPAVVPPPLHPSMPLSVSYGFIDESNPEEPQNENECVEEKVDLFEVPLPADVDAEIKEEKEEKPPKLKLRKGLHSKFIAHVGLENGDLVPPEEVLIKTWRVLNNGSHDWPLGTRLVFLNGDRRLIAENMFETACAKSGEEVEISAMITTPRKPGTYRATFRLSSPKRKLFGNKFWVEVTVFGDE